MNDRTAADATFEVVSVKGFGDLVIALTSLSWIDPGERHRVRLLLGRHLEPLFDALAPPFAATVFEHPDTGPAAVFQVRSRKLLDIGSSALGLRRALGRVHDPASALVFDEFDIRHRYLAFGRTAVTLPKADNLYCAWRDFLREHRLLSQRPDAVPVPHGRRLHIFPGAREDERRFPLPLLHELVRRAQSAGLEPRIFTIAGEMPHIDAADLPLEVLLRDFARTRDAVAGADRIISADSMTAHLAEFHGIPVYVCAPRTKPFWLPLSAATGGRHAMFTDDLDATTLPAFLA